MWNFCLQIPESVLVNHMFSFVLVVYSIESQRTAHDKEKLKISEMKKLSPHREAIRCLVNVAG